MRCDVLRCEKGGMWRDDGGSVYFGVVGCDHVDDVDDVIFNLDLSGISLNSSCNIVSYRCDSFLILILFVSACRDQSNDIILVGSGELVYYLKVKFAHLLIYLELP